MYITIAPVCVRFRLLVLVGIRLCFGFEIGRVTLDYYTSLDQSLTQPRQIFFFLLLKMAAVLFMIVDV
jgi:hypothetical protein